MDPTKTSLVIITGASQGYGCALAVTISARLKNTATFFLIARNIQGLDKTKTLIVNPNIKVYCVSADLSKKEETGTIIETCFKNVAGQTFDQCILMNNAASGFFHLFSDQLLDHDELDQYFSFNVSSPMILTARFMQNLKDEKSKIFVVMISSIAATVPLQCSGVYGAAKCARDMYSMVLAIEKPDINVLSWNPGSMDTAMFRQLHDVIPSKELRDVVQKMYDDGSVNDVDDSANKLWDILESGSYQSGQHVNQFEN